MSRYPEPAFPALINRAPDLRQFDRDLLTVLGGWSLELKTLLDRGLNVADNADVAVASFTSNATPNTEDAVAHGLGKVPTYFVVADINKGGIVYRGGTAFTKTHVYLKTSAASAVVKVLLF